MLAIHGGDPYKTTPFGSGKRFGGKELAYLEEALAQNTLFYSSGRFVKRFAEAFAGLYGMPYCVAMSSGTAAVHTALGVLDVGPGDEVIVPPVTDMGSIIGILYQNAVPVFADIDPHTYNITPEAIERAITPRTKVILLTHLAGNPCDMDPIMALARQHGIYVVEDCAQSYMTYYKGRLVGTIGDIGCFSTNDFKHISTGDGGMCIMRDQALYEAAVLFTDKGYNRFATNTLQMRTVDRLCMNYRMAELQGAVGLAQLEKLPWICEQRGRLGEALTERITGIDGLSPHRVEAGNRSSFWFYLLRIDANAFPGGNARFGEALKAEGIPVEIGYIGRCIYTYALFHNGAMQAHFPYAEDAFPYRDGLCPTAEQVLAECIKVPINEYYTQQDIEDIAGAIHKISEARGSL